VRPPLPEGGGGGGMSGMVRKEGERRGGGGGKMERVKRFGCAPVMRRAEPVGAMRRRGAQVQCCDA
jgi:hypothetical protein